jgi:hypothetical protein
MSLQAKRLMKKRGGKMPRLSFKSRCLALARCLQQNNTARRAGVGVTGYHQTPLANGAAEEERKSMMRS